MEASSRSPSKPPPACSSTWTPTRSSTSRTPMEQRYPASITKIMTALLTLEAVGRGSWTCRPW
ncbi:MAG: hypothetical protein ACLUNZ_09060 [Evtepia sp.]